MLRGVQGTVGTPEEHRLGVLVLHDRDAGRDGHLNLLRRLGEAQLGRGNANALCDGCCDRLRSTWQDDCELFPTVPPDDVVFAHLIRDGLREGNQHRIAGGVAMRVVDRLEVVDIEQHKRQRRARAAGPHDGLSEGAVEGSPVADPGEWVDGSSGTNIHELVRLSLDDVLEVS